MSQLSILHLTALLGIFVTIDSSIAATVDVTPANPENWQVRAGSTSAVAFETGPGVPVCGTGSAEFRLNAAGDAAELHSNGFHFTHLNSILGLSFSTWVEQVNGASVYLMLQVDYNADGSVDDRLIFEPAYQGETFRPNDPQAELQANVWQTWDAAGGGWWSLAGTGGATPGAGVQTLTDILAAAGGNAWIVNGPAGGGVRLVAGVPSELGFAETPAAWQGFVGNADCLSINLQGVVTTFNFDPDNTSPDTDSDNDGVEDSSDHCLPSDMTPNVDVNGDEAGVTSIGNGVDGEGCTIQDRVNALAANARNHGEYVSGIARLAKALNKAGVITKAQAGEMKKGAASSGVGKNP